MFAADPGAASSGAVSEKASSQDRVRAAVEVLAGIFRKDWPSTLEGMVGLPLLL